MNWFLGNCSIRGGFGVCISQTPREQGGAEAFPGTGEPRQSTAFSAVELTHAELSSGIKTSLSLRKTALVSFLNFLWKQVPSVVLPAAMSLGGLHCPFCLGGAFERC